MPTYSFKKVALVLLTELSSLLYSGTVFGWAPMLLVLRSEGMYADVCGEGDSWCNDQKVKLGLIFTCAAIVYSACGVFIGWFVDHFGPASCVALACVCNLAGFYFFGLYTTEYMFSDAPDWIPIMGYSLIGVGGMAYFQAAFKAQYAFPRQALASKQQANFFQPATEIVYEKQTLIIAGVTTLGDASVCMWLLVEYLYLQAGYSLESIFGAYAVLTVCLSTALAALWIACGDEILAAADGEVDDIDSDSGVYGAVQTVEDHEVITSIMPST